MFQKCRSDGVIFAAKPDAILHGSTGVPDLQMQVPTHIEHAFDQAFRPRCYFPRVQKQKIDVRIRRHFSSPIATDRHDRDALTLCWIGIRVQISLRNVEHRSDHAVCQMGVGHDRWSRSHWFFEKRVLDHFAAIRNRRFQRKDRGVTHSTTIGCFADLCFDLGAHGFIVENISCRRNQNVF